MDGKHLQKSDHFFPGPNAEEDAYGTEDCKPVINSQFFIEHFVASFLFM